METLTTKEELAKIALDSIQRLIKAGREKEVLELLSKPPVKPVDKEQSADTI